MTKYQIFSIVFSIILLPVNLRCAFWLFQEAMNLTGMTFKEFLETTSSESILLGNGRHTLRRRQRFFIRFFREKSSDPQKSIRFLWLYGLCTLPGLAALELAVYAARNVEKLPYALIGNLILIAVNITLVIWGKTYRKNNPLDAEVAERLNEKRKNEKEAGRKNRTKNIIVYSLVGAFFIGMLLFFMAGISDLSQNGASRQQTAIEVHSKLITLLNEKGYETANIPTTYWAIDESKLLHVAAGVKDGSKFEYYGYSDDETVDLVYNQILYMTAPELEESERKSHETALSDGNRMFTIEIDGVNYLVMYKNDTVIYAYSNNSLQETREILESIGYLKK